MNKSSQNQPPKIAQWILSKLLERNSQNSVIGDFNEFYSEIRQQSTVFKASIWYWMQTFKFIPCFIQNTIYWSFIMLKNYLIIAFRNFKRYKGYSFINISGLAIGIACSFLIFLWILNEMSFDKFHKNKNDIFRVISVGLGTKWFGSPAPLAPTIIDEIPEVENAVRIRKLETFVFKYNNNAFYQENGLTVDPSFFSIFSFPFLKGDLKTALSEPLNILLTEKMAKKYFGDEDPMNQSINIENKAFLKVTGILKDVPQNSHIQFDYILPYQFIDVVGLCVLKWGYFNLQTYVILSKNRNEATVINKMNKVAAAHGCPAIVNKEQAFSIQSLNDMYLNPISEYDIPLGNINYIYIFSIIGFFILFIACINFINLTTARSERRAREVGLRKVVGARKSQLIKQFLGESLLLAFLALFLAIMFVYLFISTFNNLTGKQINMSFLDIRIIITFLILALLTGLLSGSYPAFYLSSFLPVEVLRGNIPFLSKLKHVTQNFTAKGRLRKILVVIQFSLSIILIVCTVVVYNQIHFIREKSWSLKEDYIIHIPIRENIASKYETVKNELLNNPNIISVTAKDCLPLDVKNNTSGVSWEGKTDDQNSIYMETTRVSFDYFKTLNLKIIEGRSFSKEFPNDLKRAYILNKEALKRSKIENPVGKNFLLYGVKGPIVGIVEDNYFKSFRQEVKPQVYYMFSNMPEEGFFGSVFIKVKAANAASFLPETIKHIENVWNSVNSTAPFEYNFLNETIDAQYKTEKKLGKLLSYFAFLAIFISCLGLFGLASFVAERRTKEIGIRKTLGASVKNIVLLLSKEFITWVLIANIIAWPIAYLTMKKWLGEFVYRTNIGIDLFIYSAVIALSIALITISYQSIKTALANPADSLKYE